jgi:hypothetical protein
MMMDGVLLRHTVVYWQMVLGHQITQDMSRTCSIHGDGKYSYIMVGNLKGREFEGNLFASIILKLVLYVCKIIDWSDVAEGCALWRTFVNTGWTCRSYCVVIWP